MAEVVTDRALIHQTPNDAAFITDETALGDLLWVYEISPESEWLRVKPPAGALSWIPESDISEIRAGEGRVRSPKARLRPGRVGARLPGPPGIELNQGKTIWLQAREPLVIPQRQGLMTWRAIDPPDDEPRFVRRDSVRLVERNGRPEPEGFIAAKGPGALAGVAEPAEDLAEQTESGPSSAPVIGSAEPIGPQPEPIPGDAKSSTRNSPPLARDSPPPRASIEDVPILEVPDSLTSPDRARLPAVPPVVDERAPDSIDDMPFVREPSPVVGPASPLELPDDPDSALEILESRIRVIMSGPLVSWDFRPVLLASESLSRREMTSEQAARLNRLRTQAQRQEEIGQSSRQFWDSMRRSRSHDPARREILPPESNVTRTRFDLTGLLLPSRRDVDGQLLYNLIGDSGHTIAYLKLPPAAPVERWLGKKVGVRGRVRFHEDLRSRLMTVQDVEPLDAE